MTVENIQILNRAARKRELEGRQREAEARQRQYKENEFRAVARAAAADDPSDPFVYGRVLANLKCGVLSVEHVVIRDKNNG